MFHILRNLSLAKGLNRSQLSRNALGKELERNPKGERVRLTETKTPNAPVSSSSSSSSSNSSRQHVLSKWPRLKWQPKSRHNEERKR